MSAPIPAKMSGMLGRSTEAASGRRSPMGRMTRRLATQHAAPATTVGANTAFTPKRVSSRPDTNGLMAKPTPPQAVNSDRLNARRPGGAILMRQVLAVGKSSPAALACSTRAAMTIP